MTEGHGTCGQTNSREKASPKGANRIQSCSCSPHSRTVREYLSLSAGSIPSGHSTRGYLHSPPSGTVREYLSLSAGSIPFGHSTCGYSHSPPSGTVREYLSLSAGSIPSGHSTCGYSHSPPSGTEGCYLRNFSRIINTSPESAARQNPMNV